MTMGPYCNYCDHRCFVRRELPADSPAKAAPRFAGEILMATCARGMAHDRRETGYDHTTAIKPQPIDQGALRAFANAAFGGSA
jgi:hypothetical protein